MNLTETRFPPRPTTWVQDVLRPVIQDGDLAIDATAGNGYDTRFLAECVGLSGRVLALDVQQAALDSARVQVGSLEGRVEFFLLSHGEIARCAAPGSVAVVMFNLGYLPGEDHGLTTVTAVTLAALDAAAGVLKMGGVLSIVCYPGHPAGAEEAAAVETWVAARAAEGWRAVRYGAVGTRRPAPFLLLLVKHGSA